MNKNVKRRKRKGFTLIELIVVIVIIGILAALVVPRVSGFTSDAAQSVHNGNVRSLESAAMMFTAENPGTDAVWEPNSGEVSPATLPDSLPKADAWQKYVQEWPEVPNGAKDADGTVITDGTKYKVEISGDGGIKVTPSAPSGTTSP